MPDFPMLKVPTFAAHLQGGNALRLQVVALCAEWCGTCRSFRPLLERLADVHVDVAFSWLDVEDEAEHAGDLDIETFPCLAVFRDGAPLYFGAVVPLEDVVGRLIRSLAEPGAAVADVPEDVWRLGRTLVRGG